MLARAAALALCVSAAAALAGCGGGGSSSAPGGGTGPASAFDPASTRLTVISAGDRGGQFDAFFVAAPSPGDLAQARDCVRYYLANSGNRAVVCWAYPSEGALAAAGVRPVSGRQARPCWSARAGATIDGRQRTAAANPAAGTEGCPGA